MIYPYFCLHPKFNMLHIVSLDFIVALYPFFLIFLTYILVTMYDNNYRMIVWAWKPFKWCLSRYQRQLDVKASLVETFATFFLLSNVKILGICFDLLGWTTSWDSTGAKSDKQYLLYDADVEYFSLQHLPFALLALVMGFLFVFLPTLLLIVYPCRCFQHCLNSFGFRCQTLHIFMDAFQGSYKTEPRDLRPFSALYLLLRIFLVLSIVIFASKFYVAFNAILMIFSALLFSVFQPYRSNLHNKVDIVSLLMLSLFYVSITAVFIAFYLDAHWLHFGILFFASSVVFMFTHVMIVALYHCRLLTLILKVCKRAPREEDVDILIPGSLDNLDRRSLSCSPNAYTPLLSPNELPAV